MNTLTDSLKREKQFEITLYKDGVGFHCFYVRAINRSEAIKKAKKEATNPKLYWYDSETVKMFRKMERLNPNERLIAFF